MESTVSYQPPYSYSLVPVDDVKQHVLNNAGGMAASDESEGKAFTIDVRDHNYQAFKAYPDGSVAYPAAGNNNTSIRIPRVMPCND